MSANNYVDRPLAMFEENPKIQSLSESKFASLGKFFIEIQKNYIIVEIS